MAEGLPICAAGAVSNCSLGEGACHVVGIRRLLGGGVCLLGGEVCLLGGGDCLLVGGGCLLAAKVGVLPTGLTGGGVWVLSAAFPGLAASPGCRGESLDSCGVVLRLGSFPDPAGCLRLL